MKPFLYWRLRIWHTFGIYTAKHIAMKRFIITTVFFVTIAEILSAQAGGKFGGNKGNGSSGTSGQNTSVGTGTHNSPGKSNNPTNITNPGSFANMFITPSTVKFFEYGVKAGIVVNKLSTNLGDYTSTNYVGFKGGAFARFNIKKWYIQPEATFTMNGGTVYSNGNTYNIRTGAIEVPVLAGYHLIDLNFLRLRLNAGPYVSFNVSQKFDGTTPYRGEDLRKVNAGLMAGAGVDIWKIGIDLRYQFGLTNMVKSDPAFQNPLNSARNGIFEISLSYKF